MFFFYWMDSWTANRTVRKGELLLARLKLYFWFIEHCNQLFLNSTMIDQDSIFVNNRYLAWSLLTIFYLKLSIKII